MIADNVAQTVSVPLRPAQQSLLTPGAFVACGFRTLPARLARQIAQERFQIMLR